MAPLKTSPGNARASEERYRASVRGAVMDHLGTTPERAALCESALEVLWEYGGLSPFEVAAEAWWTGDRDLYEQAVADEARLDALARAVE